MTSLIRYGRLALALSLVGCGGSDDSDGPTGAADARRTADAPPPEMIAVSVAPADPQGGIKADDNPFHGINITVTVTSFTLVNPFAGDARIANVDGQGSYALFIEPSTTALVTDYRSSVLFVAVPQGTSIGPHTLRIQALQNDGTPVSPPLTGTSMPFTVM